MLYRVRLSLGSSTASGHCEKALSISKLMSQGVGVSRGGEEGRKEGSEGDNI